MPKQVTRHVTKQAKQKPKKSISRLVLGTAQLAKNYGIANRTGPPSRLEAFKILEHAWEAGVRHFDTAPAYESEGIIGDFVQHNGVGSQANALTKVSSIKAKRNWKDFLLRSVEKSFENLSTDHIKVLFLHSEHDARFLIDDPEFFQRLTEIFPIESLGISIYDPRTVNKTIAVSGDLAYQFPFSLLDRRFESANLPKGKRYARSIFLQGLLASNQIRPSAPDSVRQLHHAVWNDCVSFGLSPKEAAWAFVIQSSSVDYFLVGVETLSQLRELLKLDHIGIETVKPFVKRCLPHILEDCLDPRKWN